MDALSNLINQKVIAYFECEESTEYVEGVVKSINVNDFYFYDKNEPIYITVSIQPSNELPVGFDTERLN